MSAVVFGKSLLSRLHLHCTVDRKHFIDLEYLLIHCVISKINTELFQAWADIISAFLQGEITRGLGQWIVF